MLANQATWGNFRSLFCSQSSRNFTKSLSPCSAALVRFNDTFASVAVPSWPYAPGHVLICIGSSLAVAAATAASLPASCSSFEFVALFEGASLTGRIADTSVRLTIHKSQANVVMLYIGGSGFNREWSGTRCVLQCGSCSSFSLAAFQSSTSAACGFPPVCNNASLCDLSLSFPSPVHFSDFVVASISIESSQTEVTSHRFSVNGCISNCSALLTPFDSTLLLRFEVGSGSGSTWVQVHPHDTAVLEKTVSYAVEDVVPVHRGPASRGRTSVRECLKQIFASVFLAHSFCRCYFSSAHAPVMAHLPRSVVCVALLMPLFLEPTRP